MSERDEPQTHGEVADALVEANRAVDEAERRTQARLLRVFLAVLIFTVLFQTAATTWLVNRINNGQKAIICVLVAELEERPEVYRECLEAQDIQP